MGFFSKIFGGKKETGELETQAPEKQEPAAKKPAKVVEPEPIPEEDRVPEPEPKPEPEPESHKKSGKKGDRGKDDHKPTVFGMPAPKFTPQEEAATTASGDVELPAASGEIAVGELEVGSSGGADHAEAAGSMVVGGEDTVSATSSGEIVMDEVSVAAPVIRPSEPEPEPEAAAPAAEPEPATPAAPASPSDSGRLSGARPALLDEEEHADVDLFPKADKKDLRSSIDCGSCRHKLPVPYVGYPARITCPFCLNVNEYNM